MDRPLEQGETLMPYMRVIPRDLFNEANLLKCLGQLYLKLEILGRESMLEDQIEADEPFVVDQDPSSGATFCANVCLVVDGNSVPLFRPYNSRDAYPLRAQLGDDYDVPVFEESGDLSAEFRAFLHAW
jgi:hypothetical protein